jgi:hypothetical protein
VEACLLLIATFYQRRGGFTKKTEAWTTILILRGSHPLPRVIPAGMPESSVQGWQSAPKTLLLGLTQTSPLTVNTA